MQQTKNNHTSVIAQQKKLSIQISLDGFSFCTKNTANLQALTIADYPFTPALENPQDLVTKIKKIFSSNTTLQEDFNNIEVIHKNNLATLVPNAFFNPKKLESYLKFNIKTLATDFFDFDDVPSIQAKNVYIPYVNVNNYIFQNFGSFEYKHHSTILIEKLLQENTQQKTMFVNVAGKTLDILIIEKKKLWFANSFQFYTKEDFIYYILFVAEQLKLNTEEFPLVFLGDIKENSAIYNITYKYIKNIFFYQSNAMVLKNSNNFLPHSHFILVS